MASYGDKVNYPGQLGMQARGGQKDKANHARQVTDTSSINIFLSDEAFSSIVLGKNFFKITGLDTEFAPPPGVVTNPISLDEKNHLFSSDMQSVYIIGNADPQQLYLKNNRA